MVYINSIYTGLIVFPFIAAVYIFFIGVVRLLYPDFDGYSIYGEVYSWSFSPASISLSTSSISC